jgi:ABC-type lipoprotein export system ATPase subunit
MKNIIQLKQVAQNFKSGEEELRVLSDVSFDIKERSFTILFGQSGSGKSTLLNILSGLQNPSNGAAFFEGESIYALSQDELARYRAEKIGIVYQTNYWVKSLSVVDNVALPLYFLGYNRQDAKIEALKSLKRVGMDGYANRKPYFLSGGEQQRVAIARAMVHNPLVIIADEPTGNLDTKNGDMITSLLHEYISNQGGTVLMVTHNMEYLPLADHLLFIEDGHVKDLKTGDYKQMSKELIDETRQRIDTLAAKMDKGEKP